MEFKEIWDEFKTPLKNFIKANVNDQMLVEDILQEVSIKLLSNIDRGTEIKNHQTWLFQVTRNTIADYFRKKNKEINLPTIQTEENQPTTHCVCDLSGFIIQNYLPEKYGRPLYLNAIDGRAQKEVSEILNLSLTATKSRIQRGRAKLKEVISDWVEISYNQSGQVTDFYIKKNCNLPKELLTEIEKLNLEL